MEVTKKYAGNYTIKINGNTYTAEQTEDKKEWFLFIHEESNLNPNGYNLEWCNAFKTLKEIKNALSN